MTYCVRATESGLYGVYCDPDPESIGPLTTSHADALFCRDILIVSDGGNDRVYHNREIISDWLHGLNRTIYELRDTEPARCVLLRVVRDIVQDRLERVTRP